eukprot:s1584_g13.t1
MLENKRGTEENHAHFDVPAGGSAGSAGSAGFGGGSGAAEQTLAELRELHRDGEKATTLGLRHLEDVLRQYFLGQPNPSAPPSPNRLPRLLSPKPFVNARAKTAEVLKLSTDPATEFKGCFFPQQLQYFLALLRVCYPKFRCELGAGRVSKESSSQGPQGRGGLNAFTLLKQHRIESVSCDRVDAWPFPEDGQENEVPQKPLCSGSCTPCLEMIQSRQCSAGQFCHQCLDRRTNKKIGNMSLKKSQKVGENTNMWL